jgi:hypothetical protein
MTWPRLSLSAPAGVTGKRSKKWGRCLHASEFGLDDHGPTRAPINVWSEIAWTLDSRSLTGQHIFDHIRWEVEQETWIEESNRLCCKWQLGTIELVDGPYVHPVTRLLCYKSKGSLPFGGGSFVKAQAALRAICISASTVDAIRCCRVDGQRVWEHREVVGSSTCTGTYPSSSFE